MGFFDKFRGNQNNNTAPAQQNVYTAQASSTGEVTLDLSKGGLLNLEKNQFLNLSKTGISLKDIRVGAGWDVVHIGKNYDLDLCAFVLDVNNKLIKTSRSIIYYGKKEGQGLQLDKDNLTGEGDGDDENIFVNFDAIDQNAQKVLFNVVIYRGLDQGQDFGHVKNAFVRLVDQSVRPEKELVRYNLSSEGGANTAIEFAQIERTPEGWTFKAIGNFSRVKGIEELANKYR